jgi:hypothetical protein
MKRSRVLLCDNRIAPIHDGKAEALTQTGHRRLSTTLSDFDQSQHQFGGSLTTAWETPTAKIEWLSQGLSGSHSIPDARPLVIPAGAFIAMNKPTKRMLWQRKQRRQRRRERRSSQNGPAKKRGRIIYTARHVSLRTVQAFLTKGCWSLYQCS